MSSCCCSDYMDWCWKFLCEDSTCPTPCGCSSAYGYIYNLDEKKFETKNDNTPMPFNRTGIVKGIDHPSPTDIKIIDTGIYLVTFYCDPNSKTKIYLTLNGEPLPQSVYSPNAASTIEFGQSIIKVATKNSILQLIIVKQNTIFQEGDGETVDASINIHKLDEI